MTTLAWFHCFSGIAGDMTLGSLLDAGADEAAVIELLRRLPVRGWDIRREGTLRGGIACTRVVVEVKEGAQEHGSRTHRALADAVRAASLPTRVERRALDTFSALAEAEGRLHGLGPTEVHFHEVGGHDALIDVVGAAAALEVLGVDEVTTSAIAVGTGTIRAAHGALPNPPPAVLRLLEGFPTYGRPVGVELTTPTGAALVRALAASAGPMPAMTVRSSGYGAGSAELDSLPNCTQVVIGEAAGARAQAGSGQPVTVLEANLDDATGEQLALALTQLIARGALDAWITPVVMKKGRPAHTVHVLCDPALAEPLAELVRQTTGTFGVRATDAMRWAEARRIDEVSVEGRTVRMKVGIGHVKAEHEDVARVAAETGLSAHEVASRAEEAWRGAEFRRSASVILPGSAGPIPPPPEAASDRS